MRQWYEINHNFTFGTTGQSSVLHTFVNSRKAVDDQLKANRQWLTSHGHNEGEVVFTPCPNPNK